jgi:hypothetical protein
MAKIVLKGARLSFPSLFATEQYNGQDTGKFAATFLVEKDSKAAKAIAKATKEAIKEKFGKDAPKKLKSAVKDGDEVDYDGYEGMVAIKANTKKRPVLIDRDKSPITEEDGTLYAGCYVNVSLEIYGLDNQYGKRVSCQLNGIQFAKDGEAFGNSNDTMGDFDELDDDDDDGENPFG